MRGRKVVRMRVREKERKRERANDPFVLSFIHRCLGPHSFNLKASEEVSKWLCESKRVCKRERERERE
jgi:hypothetical protein